MTMLPERAQCISEVARLNRYIERVNGTMARQERLEKARYKPRPVLKKQSAPLQRKTIKQERPEIVAPPPVSRSHLCVIAAQVMEKHGLASDVFFSRVRTRSIAWARQEAMYRMKEETTASYPQIGRIFDMDHTTIIHAVRAHKERLAQQENKEG